jgi:hypothetical protein
MLTGIRITLTCLLVAVGVIAPSDSEPQLSSGLENQYVSVTVFPPLESWDNGDVAIGINSSKTPLVQLVVPFRAVSAETDILKAAPSGNVIVRYVPPGEGYNATRSYADHVAFIFVGLKLAPPKFNMADDAVKADPTHNEILFENRRVRVLRIHFAPGELGPMVDKRPRVIFARYDSHATVTLPDGHNEIREMKAGAISFGNAGRQATKNTGTTPLENIVVELKSRDSEKK